MYQEVNEIIDDNGNKTNIVTVARELLTNIDDKTSNIFIWERLITPEMTLEYPDVNWDKIKLCDHIYTEDFIENHKEIPYDVDSLMTSTNITPEFVVKNFNVSDDKWFLFVNNRNLTKEFILNHRYRPWPWKSLHITRPAIIDEELVTELYDMDWNWEYIVTNCDFVDKNLVRRLLDDKKITEEFINHPHRSKNLLVKIFRRTMIRMHSENNYERL